jgi:hypothetical protein
LKFIGGFVNGFYVGAVKAVADCILDVSILVFSFCAASAICVFVDDEPNSDVTKWSLSYIEHRSALKLDFIYLSVSMKNNIWDLNVK